MRTKIRPVRRTPRRPCGGRARLGRSVAHRRGGDRGRVRRRGDPSRRAALAQSASTRLRQFATDVAERMAAAQTKANLEAEIAKAEAEIPALRAHADELRRVVRERAARLYVRSATPKLEMVVSTETVVDAAHAYTSPTPSVTTTRRWRPSSTTPRAAREPPGGAPRPARRPRAHHRVADTAARAAREAARARHRGLRQSATRSRTAATSPMSPSARRCAWSQASSCSPTTSGSHATCSTCIRESTCPRWRARPWSRWWTAS